jgi:glycosyltransferase involved in cell wall biosynthesis
MANKIIVFLYTELAEYFLSCIRELSKADFVGEIHVVHWPINQEAPFQFSYPEGVHFYTRENFSDTELLGLITSLSPDFIYSSGWIDKGYKKVCKRFKGKVPTVLGLDNRWTGSPRQKAASMLSRFLIAPYFSYAWVPGEKQKKYAKMLGFKEDKIHTGFYVADIDFFEQCYQKFKVEKEENFPKRFIYVGRYVEHKGLRELWSAFIKMKETHQNDWELWCLGTGHLEKEKPNHPAIKHFGFIQPNDIEPFLQQTGVFVLPSKFEPWGVVVHEFAAAGFPMLLSKDVGACETFLDKNGYKFNRNKEEDFLLKIINFVNLSNEELNQMAHNSNSLSRLITKHAWVNTIKLTTSE